MSRTDGRPSQDAEFQNLKSGSNITTRRLVAADVSTAAVVAGEVVADVGAFNTLNVENLTVTNSNALNEVVSNTSVQVPLWLVANDHKSAVTGNPLVNPGSPPYVSMYGNGTAPPGDLADTVSWTVYVPNSGAQRRVRVWLDAALGANGTGTPPLSVANPHLIVSINGTVVSTLAAENEVGYTLSGNVPDPSYPYVYDTAAFEWTAGGPMTIALKGKDATASGWSGPINVREVIVY